MGTTAEIFDTVPAKDYLSLFSGPKPKYGEVVDYLDLSKEEVAKAAQVPLASVRYDERISKDLSDRILEWAVLLNLVGQYFKGDGDKTALWFKIPNPQFGGVTPRDMLRLGRFHKLSRYILHALEENKR